MILPYKATTSSAVLSVKSAVSRVILVAGSANASVVLDDSTDGSGTAKIEIKALANTSESADLENGVLFDTGVYATLAGSGAKVYVYTR